MYKFNQKAGQDAGLRLWIAFTVGFWLAGLRAEICVLLGAVGGLATYFLVSAWQAEKVDPPPAKPAAPKETLGIPGPLGQVFRKPAERFRKTGLLEKLPKLPKLPELPKLPRRERRPRRKL
ncbi:MAG: hypothetical protein ACKO7W_21750 [Elainella sp.]